MRGFEGSSLGLVLFPLFALDLFPSTPPFFSTRFLFLFGFIFIPFLFSPIWWSILLESHFRVCSAAHAVFLVYPLLALLNLGGDFSP